ncbi:WD repeat-containing protein 89-like [Pecten maximus]|uniref:WD repeat-containing protein 89-like n=1 Tax=Pecten maximus TaxID=6579 RepID=UPI0014589426|nr:WD repeat-containing protein 89-like [Pecten maximus]
MADTSELSELLSQLKLARLSELSQKDIYVLGLAVQHSDSTEKLLAATSSNHTVRLFNYGSGTLKGTQHVTAHTDVISGIQFGKSVHHLLYTSSFDKTIKCWDSRTNMKDPVQILEGFDETNNIFTSFDVNSNDRVVCAGTESKNKNSDTHIIFWDRRQGSLMGAYNESHQDDITQVCFHPDDPDRVATGSTDGLVCVFDLGENTEDDALKLTLNSESSVAKIGWCGERRKDLYCLTHIDTMNVWDTQNDGEDIMELKDLKETLQGDDSIDYLVDCFDVNNRLFLTTGTHSGDIRLVDVSGDAPCVVTTLSKGHNSTVRVTYWDSQTTSLVTGGEDSYLCLWSKDGQLRTPHGTVSVADGQVTPSHGKVKSKMKSASHKKSRPY